MDTVETKVYYGLLICCALLAVLFLYIGIRVIRRQRRQYALEREQYQAEAVVREAERLRIARDLHDELGPELAIIRIQVSEINTSDPESLLIQQKANRHIINVIERMGGIVRDLGPRRFEEKGLDESLQEYFADYRELTDIQLSYRYDVSSRPGADIGLPVYRMVQELVHNGVRHSQAKSVKVHIKEREGKLYINYLDDGIGCHEEKYTRGTGLQSIAGRVRMLGGVIREIEKKGTGYFIEIPLNNHHEEKDQADTGG